MTQNNKSMNFESIFSLLLKAYKKLLIFIFIGAVLGFLIFINQASIYTTTYVFKTELFSKDYAITIGDNLNELCLKKDVKKISILMNLNPNNIRSLDGILLTYYNENLFKIKLSSFDSLNIPLIKKGIIYYLLNDIFIKEKITNEKKYYNTILFALDSEIVKLNEIRFDFQNNPKNYTVSNISEINKTLIEFKEKKASFLNKLKDIDKITFNDYYSESIKKTSRSLYSCIFKWVIFASIFGFIAIIGLELIKPNSNKKENE